MCGRVLMCMCSDGVGRGQAAPCQGQGMGGESSEGTWEWVMEGSCKSPPRGSNKSPGGRWAPVPTS